MREFGSQTYRAVASGLLAEPFNGAMAKTACPGWADRTYFVFFNKHRVGNGKETELFKRVRPGWYRTLPELMAGFLK